jgi:hypothetical protein
MQHRDLCPNFRGRTSAWKVKTDFYIYGLWIKDVGLSLPLLASRMSDDTLHLSVHLFFNDAVIKSNDTASNHRVTVNS